MENHTQPASDPSDSLEPNAQAGDHPKKLRLPTREANTSPSTSEKDTATIVVQERNLQEIFLNTCRKEKMLVTVFLVSGIKLQGKISWFDTYCIALQREGHVQLVYKHGISTIVPMQKMQLKPAEGAATAS